MQVPAFWKTKLDDIEQAWQNAKCEKSILGYSAGNRPIYMLAYGPKKVKGQANYSSALGAHDRSCYSPAENKTPAVILMGATHGQETEGTASLMNLISLMETGVDLAGAPNPALVEAAKQVRLVIIPVLNVDGRARVQPEAIVGLTGRELRYWGQGTWKNGELCGWPECKRVHPILEHVGFLGGYYNDDGINLMHDNFFHPMARETQAFLDLCAEEQPDWVLHLHGGSNSLNDLLQPSYVPYKVNEAIYNLAARCDKAGGAEGLNFHLSPIPTDNGSDPFPTFNLVCAVHHVCGAISATFESNECLIDEPGPHFTHEQILRSHMILFEQCILTALGT